MSKERQRQAAKLHQLTKSTYRRIQCRLCPGYIVKASAFKDHMKSKHKVSHKTTCIWCMNHTYDKIDYEHVLKCVVKSTHGYTQTLSACDQCDGERKDILNELQQQTIKITNLEAKMELILGCIQGHGNF